MIGRYDYIPADSSAGVVIYDDVFAYSHHATDPACGKLMNAFDVVRIHKFGNLDEKVTHATDPACGKLMNAFDVVRIHKFGNLDEKVTEEIETTKLPSFKAMQDLIRHAENL